jgi:hypothetical protein
MSQARANGWAMGGINDDLKFVEPEGKAYVIIDQHLKELIDAIHAVVNQMGSTVSAKAVTAARSGLSKMMDNYSKELVLTAYAQLMKEFAIRLFGLVSDGRNEDLLWRTIGMEDFSHEDRDQLILEATQIQMVKIPSKTWLKHYSTDIALKLARDLNAEARMSVEEEIAEYVEGMDIEEMMNPTPPEMPGLPGQPGQKPIAGKPSAKKPVSGNKNGK